MVYEYLMLQLVRTGVKNPVVSGNNLYFSHDNNNYIISDWEAVIKYKPQHNAPNIVEAVSIIDKNDWQAVMRIINGE